MLTVSVQPFLAFGGSPAVIRTKLHVTVSVVAGTTVRRRGLRDRSVTLDI